MPGVAVAVGGHAGPVGRSAPNAVRTVAVPARGCAGQPDLRSDSVGKLRKLPPPQGLFKTLLDDHGPDAAHHRDRPRRPDSRAAWASGLDPHPQ